MTDEPRLPGGDRQAPTPDVPTRTGALTLERFTLVFFGGALFAGQLAESVTSGNAVWIWTLLGAFAASAISVFHPQP